MGRRSTTDAHQLSIVLSFSWVEHPCGTWFLSLFTILIACLHNINFFLLLLRVDVLAQAAVTKISNWMVWTIKMYALWFGRLGRPRLRLQQILCQVRPYFRVHRQPSIFSLCPAVEGGARELLETFYQGTDSVDEAAPSWSNPPPQTPPPNIITLAVRIST